MKSLLAAAVATLLAWPVAAQPAPHLNLPPRPGHALDGAALADAVRELALPEREARLLKEITSGNVPDFLRTLRPVTLTNDSHVLTCWVTPDYLAVGCATNFLRVPLTPITAQQIADALDCSLPTPAMVDAIWRTADVKLEPQPLAPGPAMTTVAAFVEHQAQVQAQLGTRHGLVAGHKKDVVLAPHDPDRVAIYGWHRLNGRPIQPLFTKHAVTWVDYSHGIRLVANAALLDGQPVRLPKVLTNAPRYATAWPTGPEPNAASSKAPTVTTTNRFAERESEFNLDPEVRVRLNVPADSEPATNELLVLFALPNGNTIEQTAGRHPHDTNEWRYDIQHIAAQTRFVRAALPGTRVGVAYLEARGLSWPAWRKRHGNAAIPGIVQAVRTAFSTNDGAFVLSAHSGGGSFIFGYLESVASLPPELRRIAWLDANYAYDPAKHRDKIVNWLRADADHRLLVFAYEDSAALLNGKPFVSATGGTWGRSAAMREDFGRQFDFNRRTNGRLRTESTADGCIEFYLRENPERKIWHTVLVERNGFIHALLTGTTAENRGYTYLGARAYEPYIAP